MTKSLEELGIEYIPGNVLFVKRFEVPSEDEDGILSPESISLEHENVNKSQYRATFQHKGEIVAIGHEVKEPYELGDVVHLLGPGDIPIYMDKTDPDQWDLGSDVSTPYVRTDASHGVAFVEKK